ncbi:MAG: dipeptidase [Bacteroidia bacterium]|nr:dipeptidase [Bacteroidia bacterium]MDW8014517.1 dipeptidase [Bacteroidia bacterium]
MTIDQWIEERKEVLLSELMEFLRFPSISAQKKHWDDLHRTALWLKDRLERLGFTTTLLGEPPVVWGHYKGAQETPTVVFYGHYDVQPPDPLSLWESPPFEPQIRGEAIYARGAADDKGQVFAHLAVWQYFMESQGRIPLSIHALIEGEEETGSKTFSQILRENEKAWRGDVGIVSDTAFFSKDVPTLTIGLRGLVYTEIRVCGPARDLHSGGFGGVVANPALALAHILSALKGPDERVRIPGFYEKVRPASAAERRWNWELPANEAHYQRLTGAPAIVGEVGFSPLERIGIRPTLDVNGLWSGYTGEGSKTIIPAEAVAKVSMRLVPHQEPREVWESFRQYVERIAPSGVTVSVSLLHEPAPPFETPVDSLAYQLAAAAMERAFGKAPLPLREGGSIPILNLLQQATGGIPIVLMGFGLPSDAVHSPNEHFQLNQLWKGIKALAYFYESLAAKK